MFRKLTILAAMLLVAGAAAAEERKAVFAAGCFWCAEAAFETVPGVIDVVSGYAGGTAETARYDQVSAHDTAHLEVVEVRYDPSKVTFDALLYVFWRNVDPFDASGQFCDKGPQYRAAIFTGTPEERAAAEKSKAELVARFGQSIETLVLDAKPFYPAEAYHQDYHRQNHDRYGYYRLGCGRDARLDAVWGAEARAGKPAF